MGKERNCPIASFGANMTVLHLKKIILLNLLLGLLYFLIKMIIILSNYIENCKISPVSFPFL